MPYASMLPPRLPVASTEPEVVIRAATAVAYGAAEMVRQTLAEPRPSRLSIESAIRLADLAADDALAEEKAYGRFVPAWRHECLRAAVAARRAADEARDWL
jgi:hypothetical protein